MLTHIHVQSSDDMEFSEVRVENIIARTLPRISTSHARLSERSKRLLWSGGGNHQTACFKTTKMCLRRTNHRTLCSTISYVHKHWINYLLMVFILFSQNLSIHAICPDEQDCYPPVKSLYHENLIPFIGIRGVIASSTCGESGDTLYRMHSGLHGDRDDFTCSIGAHTVTFLSDRTPESIEGPDPGTVYTYDNPTLLTYWQSSNTIVESAGVNSPPEEVSIVINLRDPLLIRYLRLIFVAPHVNSASTDENIDMRPKAMAIERQATPGSAFEPWRVFAEDCASVTSYAGTVYANMPIVRYTDEIIGIEHYVPEIPFCEEKFYAMNSATYTGWGFGRQQVNHCESRKIFIK